MLISPQSVNKHDRHRQFLFLVRQFLKKKIFSSETAWSDEPNLVGSIYGRSSITSAHLIPNSVHLMIVSSNLLCQAKYCVDTYFYIYSTFHCRHTAVVSCFTLCSPLSYMTKSCRVQWPLHTFHS